MNFSPPTAAARRACLRSMVALPSLLMLNTFVTPLHAQTGPALWPNKPVRIVVPFGAGGSTDALARALADKLQARLGQPFIVDNKPGATGIIGSDAVAKAPPDGHTLLINGGPLAVYKLLNKSVPFDTQRDLAPVTLLARGDYMLLTSPAVPAKTLKEFIAYARSKPGLLNYGSPGRGGVMLATELFNKLAGLQLVNVPYKSANPATLALMSNEIQLMFDGGQANLGNIESGKLRALAVSGNHRLEALPKVPTVAEAGLRGFQASYWQGLLTTAGTPREVIDKINAAVVATMQEPEMKARMQLQGDRATTSTPAQLAQLIEADTKLYAEVAQFAGIAPE